MKKFIRESWYKLMIGLSLLMASFGFMIYSITSANAKSPGGMYSNFPVNTDGSISVKLSDDQLNKIIPKNEDGSVNIKLSEKQLKALEPNALQDVNIIEVQSQSAGAHWSYNSGGVAFYALDVVSRSN